MQVWVYGGSSSTAQGDFQSMFLHVSCCPIRISWSITTLSFLNTPSFIVISTALIPNSVTSLRSQLTTRRCTPDYATCLGLRTARYLVLGPRPDPDLYNHWSIFLIGPSPPLPSLCPRDLPPHPSSTPLIGSRIVYWRSEMTFATFPLAGALQLPLPYYYMAQSHVDLEMLFLGRAHFCFVLLTINWWANYMDIWGF